MKVITLSDGTQVSFPEASDGYNQGQLDHVEQYIMGLKYPISSFQIGSGGATVEYASPDQLFSKTKEFDGVKIQRIYR